MRKCLKCGEKLNDNTKFCGSCGECVQEQEKNIEDIQNYLIEKEVKDAETEMKLKKCIIWTVFSIGGTIYCPFPIWILIILIIVDILLILSCINIRAQIKRRVYCTMCPRCQQDIQVSIDSNVVDCPACGIKLLKQKNEFVVLH